MQQAALLFVAPRKTESSKEREPRDRTDTHTYTHGQRRTDLYDEYHHVSMNKTTIQLISKCHSLNQTNSIKMRHCTHRIYIATSPFFGRLSLNEKVNILQRVVEKKKYK